MCPSSGLGGLRGRSLLGRLGGGLGLLRRLLGPVVIQVRVQALHNGFQCSVTSPHNSYAQSTYMNHPCAYLGGSLLVLEKVRVQIGIEILL